MATVFDEVGALADGEQIVCDTAQARGGLSGVRGAVLVMQQHRLHAQKEGDLFRCEAVELQFKVGAGDEVDGRACGDGADAQDAVFGESQRNSQGSVVEEISR